MPKTLPAEHSGVPPVWNMCCSYFSTYRTLKLNPFQTVFASHHSLHWAGPCCGARSASSATHEASGRAGLCTLQRETIGILRFISQSRQRKPFKFYHPQKKIIKYINNNVFFLVIADSLVHLLVVKCRHKKVVRIRFCNC